MLHQGRESEIETLYDLAYLQPQANYLSRWAALSEPLRRAGRARLDIPYGAGARDRLDFYPASGPANAPTLVFIHGGYWQRGDKSVYGFLAKPFVEQGVSVVMLNYDFCPSVRLGDIVAQTRRGIAWLWGHAESLSIDRGGLYVMGHSAGAHLSAMMMATDWTKECAGAPESIFLGGVLISGIFDLAPLLFSSQNDQLKLTLETASAWSAMGRPNLCRGPLLVVSGADESEGFNGQSDAYTQALETVGHAVRRYRAPGRGHFSVLDELAAPDSALYRLAWQAFGQPG